MLPSGSTVPRGYLLCKHGANTAAVAKCSLFDFQPKPASTAFLFRSILGYFAVLDLTFPTKCKSKPFWNDYKIHQNPTSTVLQVGSSASVCLFFSFEDFLLCSLYPNSSGFVGEGNDPNKGTKMSIVRSYQES